MVKRSRIGPRRRRTIARRLASKDAPAPYRRQHADLLGRDGPFARRGADPRDRRRPLFRHQRRRLGVHARVPDPEPDPRAGGRRGALQRLRPGLQRAAGEQEEARGLSTRQRARRAAAGRADADHARLHPDRAGGSIPLFTGDEFTPGAGRARRRPLAGAVPDRDPARADRAGGRDPQRPRPVRDPGDRAAGVEHRDHRRDGRPRPAVRGRRQALRLRHRRRRGHARAAADDAPGAAARSASRSGRSGCPSAATSASSAC